MNLVTHRLLRLRPPTRKALQHILSLVALLAMLSIPCPAIASEDAPSTVFLPLAINSFCKPIASTPFGLQLYGDTGKNSPYYADLRDSKASWVRVYINWADAEPANTTPDKYQWGQADAAVSGAKDLCLNMIPVIVTPPAWARLNPGTFGEVIKTEALPDFAQFVQAVAERYDGDGSSDAAGSPTVRYWELFNEPDMLSLPNADVWGDHGAMYAAMLAAAYPAIKAGNPQAKVIFGGIAYDWWKETSNGPFSRAFLDDVLKAGGGANFDIMNYHVYPLFAPNWTTQNSTGLIEKAAAIRAKLQSYNLNKPMVITEMGWHNNPKQNPASSDETQVRFVVSLFVQTMAADIQFGIWWTLSDIPDYLDTGLVTFKTPSTRKLSFTVFNQLTKEMSSATFERTLPVAETGNQKLEVHKFADPAQKRSIYVAWLNPVETTATAPLSIPATQVTLRTILGEASTVSDAADGQADGKVTINVGGRPVYIEVGT